MRIPTLASGPDMARIGSGGMRGVGARMTEAMIMILTTTTTGAAMTVEDNTMIDTTVDTATTMDMEPLDLAGKTTVQATSASNHRLWEITDRRTQLLARLEEVNTHRQSILRQQLLQEQALQLRRT